MTVPHWFRRCIDRLHFALRGTVPVLFEPTRLVYPDPLHLEGVRSVLRSPQVQNADILGLLIRDPQISELLPAEGEQRLLQVAIVGDELRANVYRVTEDDRLPPVYRENWQNLGVTHYLLNFRGQLKLVLRPQRGLYYHSDRPTHSYTRVLDEHELASVNDLCVRHFL